MEIYVQRLKDFMENYPWISFLRESHMWGECARVWWSRRHGCHCEGVSFRMFEGGVSFLWEGVVPQWGGTQAFITRANISRIRRGPVEGGGEGRLQTILSWFTCYLYTTIRSARHFYTEQPTKARGRAAISDPPPGRGVCGDTVNPGVTHLLLSPPNTNHQHHSLISMVSQMNQSQSKLVRDRVYICRLYTTL